MELSDRVELASDNLPVRMRKALRDLPLRIEAEDAEYPVRLEASVSGTRIMLQPHGGCLRLSGFESVDYSLYRVRIDGQTFVFEHSHTSTQVYVRLVPIVPLWKPWFPDEPDLMPE